MAATAAPSMSTLKRALVPMAIPAGAVIKGTGSSLGSYTVRIVGTYYCTGVAIARRRKKRVHKDFAPELSDLKDEYPEYYMRNFHYQTDGYLSALSAELYEHQVEMLFSGTADPMRRALLSPMKSHFKSSVLYR